MLALNHETLSLKQRTPNPPTQATKEATRIAQKEARDGLKRKAMVKAREEAQDQHFSIWGRVALEFRTLGCRCF